MTILDRYEFEGLEKLETWMAMASEEIEFPGEDAEFGALVVYAIAKQEIVLAREIVELYKIRTHTEVEFKEWIAKVAQRQLIHYTEYSAIRQGSNVVVELKGRTVRAFLARVLGIVG